MNVSNFGYEVAIDILNDATSDTQASCDRRTIRIASMPYMDYDRTVEDPYELLAQQMLVVQTRVMETLSALLTEWKGSVLIASNAGDKVSKLAEMGEKMNVNVHLRNGELSVVIFLPKKLSFVRGEKPAELMEQQLVKLSQRVSEMLKTRAENYLDTVILESTPMQPVSIELTSEVRYGAHD